MKKVTGRWESVQVEDFVEDKDGKAWRVDRWDHVAAALTDKDGRRATVRPDPLSEVTIYRRTMKDAVRLVERELGGVIIEEIREDT